MNRNLATLAPLLRRTLGEDIVLTVDVALDIWPVRVDSAQLDSCIVNLADNGRDAMPQGGLLRISARNVEIDEVDAREMKEAVPGDYVLIEVADGGVGMEPDIVAQAFEPFFSTKPVGHGTGLGLSMVYGFMKQSDGWVRIASKVGHGTKVGLYLPRDGVADHAVVTSGAAPAPAVPGTQTILIVEDNPMMREVAMEQLSSLGYRVIEAEQGAAALAILAQPNQRIDLLFTDVIMPGEIDGFELIRRARALRPDIKALMTSGYPGDVPGKSRLTGVNLLAKPYRLADMRTAIRAALDARP